MAEQKSTARPTCSVEHCDKLSWCRGWCQSHYGSWRKHGDVEHVDRVKANRRKTCSVSTCDEKVHSHGYCGRHAHRFKRHGDPLGERDLFSNAEKLGFITAALMWPVDAGCLIWPYPTGANGYAQLKWRDGRRDYGHRIVCREAHGEPPAGRRHVAHSCGNPRCVAAGHVRWASVGENMDDKKMHGTYGCHLSEETARAVLKDEGLLREIAERHGVSVTHVHQIRSGKAWGWLREES